MDAAQLTDYEELMHLTKLLRHADKDQLNYLLDLFENRLHAYLINHSQEVSC